MALYKSRRNEYSLEFKLFSEADESIKKQTKHLSPTEQTHILAMYVDSEDGHDSKIEVYLDNLLKYTKDDVIALLFMIDRVVIHEYSQAFSGELNEEKCHIFTDKVMNILFEEKVRRKGQI
jgi:hypothetical protein